MNRPSPAIVTQTAVRRLPRWALLLFCVAYVVPGFVGREPWKNADMTALGYMFELAQGNAPWLQPRLLGQPPEFDGLLPYWLGAWAMRLAPSGMAADFAARLPFMALLALALLATWYAVYHLARSPAAQPVAFAFGGEAQPTDYARAMADAGLLALIACLGLAQLSHETTPASAQLGFTALSFYGIAALPHRTWAGPMALLCGLVGLALSGAPTMAVLFGAGGLLLAMRREPDQEVPRQRALAVIAACLIVCIALATAVDAWHWRIGNPGGRDWRSLGRMLVWFTWPAWPLALWTAWRWRRQWLSRHLALPLWFAIVTVGTSVATTTPDRSLLLSMPALAALAAFALPTFQRSAAALIDWFTLIFFTGFGLVIWVVWISLQTGVPAKPAANVAKLAPGFEPSFGILAFVLALAGTLAWAWLVKWRVGRHREAIWKSLVLPAGGAAWCWLLLMTLWLPTLDYARSYTPVVANVQKLMTTPGCVEVLGLSSGQVAAMRYHGRMDLRNAGSAQCAWLLLPHDLQPVLPIALDARAWKLAGTVRRPSDAKDTLLVYKRVAAR